MTLAFLVIALLCFATATALLIGPQRTLLRRLSVATVIGFLGVLSLLAWSFIEQPSPFLWVALPVIIAIMAGPSFALIRARKLNSSHTNSGH